MGKILLVDLDGCVILREKYFSQRLVDEMGGNKEAILAFFTGPYKQCAAGNADLKQLLDTHMASFGLNTQVNAEQLMQTWFTAETTLNAPVVTYLKELKTTGIPLYCVTDNEKYRMAFLHAQVFPQLELFDGVFASSDESIHATKETEAYWLAVDKLLPPHKPEEITVIDDDEKNLKAPHHLSCKTLLYTPTLDLRTELRTFLA